MILLPNLKSCGTDRLSQRKKNLEFVYGKYIVSERLSPMFLCTYSHYISTPSKLSKKHPSACHLFVPSPKSHHTQNFAPKLNNCNLRDKHYLCVHTACPCPAQPGELLSNFPLPGRPQRRISVKFQIEECLRTPRTSTNVKIYCLQCPLIE